VRRVSFFLLTVGVILFLAAQTSSCEQPDGGQASTSVQTLPLDDVELHFGPFAFAGQSFNVVLHEKRLKGVPDFHLAQTLAALEIRDQNGVDLYQKAFPVEVEQGKFKQAIQASVRLLVGRGDIDGLADSIRRRAGNNARGLLASYTGLLVDYQLYSASGGSEEAWQLFGYRDGKLALFDKPTRMDSPMGNPPAFAMVAGPNGTTPVPIAPSGDVFEFRVWTGNFYVMVPVTVDWGQGKLAPAQRCLGMRNPPALQDIGCPLRVEAERRPPDAEMTFLRLLNGQSAGEGQAKHVVLDKKSAIRFLQASAIVDWGPAGDFMQIRLRDLWLQVLIDNDDHKSGWIQTDEDFAAVGLPSRSATP
jgi:hypothetical protein